MSEVFGPMRHPGELESAVVGQLEKWLPTYIAHMGEVGGQRLAPPKSIEVVSEYGTFPEAKPPALVVESAGLVGPPTQDGEGNLSGTFAVEVTALVSSTNAKATRDLGMNYGVAVIGALMQHRALADGIWVDEHIDMAFAGANVELRRTRVAIANVFHVTLQNFLNVSTGPLEPTEIPDDWPIAETVETTVEQKET